MADRNQLKENMAQTVDKCSSEYEFEIAKYANGLAVDITSDGDSIDKVVIGFAEAAMDAGFVVIGTYVCDYFDHTRIFLGDAADYFDLAEPLQRIDAKDYIKSNNDFPYGEVIKVGDNKLHVYAPNTSVSSIDTPKGWRAQTLPDGNGDGIEFVTVGKA